MILQATVISCWIFSHFLCRYEIIIKRRVICMDYCVQKRVNLLRYLWFRVIVTVITTDLWLESL